MPTSSDRPARKAVIPAAGLGTRFLPATKAVPKELLPVVDRPALQYIVEEAARRRPRRRADGHRPGQDAIEDHFDRAPELEDALEKKGDAERLAAVRASTELAQVHFVRQGEPRGLGHAVLQPPHSSATSRSPCCSATTSSTPATTCSSRCSTCRPSTAARWWRCSRSAGRTSTSTAPRRRAGRHTGDGDGSSRSPGWSRSRRSTRRPSNLAIIGRYVLPPEIFDVLRRHRPGRGGEIQLTDALATLVERGEPVHGVVFSGRRYDTGDKLDYLKAVVRLASERDDLGPPLRAWLREFVDGLPAEGASPS